MQFVVQSGAEPGKTYDLGSTGQLTVGRQSANDIVVSDEQVSRRHAEIKAVAGGALVTDLGSSNGTFVNGARVSSPQMLKPNDTLQIGTTVLRLVDTDNVTSTLPAGYEQPAPTTVGNYNFGGGYDNNNSYQAGANQAASAAQQAAPFNNYSQPPIPAADSYKSPNVGAGYVPPASNSSGYGQAPGYDQNQAGNFGGYNQNQASAGAYNPNSPYQTNPNAYPPQVPNQNYGVAAPVPATPAKRRFPLPLPVLIILLAVIALLVIGGVLYLVLGSGSSNGLPKPNNSTKLDISTEDYANIIKASGQNIDLSKVKLDTYSTKESISSLTAYYKDQMSKAGWSLDTTKGSGDTLYFKKGDQSSGVSFTNIADDTTLTLYKTTFPKAKDQLHVGDTLVALVSGPTDAVNKLNGSVNSNAA